MDGCAQGDFVAAYDARHAEWVVGRVLTVRGGEAHVAWHARAGHVEEWCVPFAALHAVHFEAGAPPPSALPSWGPRPAPEPPPEPPPLPSPPAPFPAAVPPDDAHPGAAFGRPEAAPEGDKVGPLEADWDAAPGDAGEAGHEHNRKRRRK